MMIYPQQPLILCLVLSSLAFVKANWQEWWTYDGISGTLWIFFWYLPSKQPTFAPCMGQPFLVTTALHSIFIIKIINCITYYFRSWILGCNKSCMEFMLKRAPPKPYQFGSSQYCPWCISRCSSQVFCWQKANIWKPSQYWTSLGV